MKKLRKMLGDADSRECRALMHLMETQSKTTLAAWAMAFAKENYLTVYEKECPEDLRLGEILSACEELLTEGRPARDWAPLLNEAAEIARRAEGAALQAAARAVAAACAVVRTPTSALGFLFYGAAAAVYSRSGLEQTAAFYDAAAAEEFQKALCSLREAAIPEEKHPANLKWHC